jgi:hypothetical protein
MEAVVLTNVYNEEYLLPFWLEHHKGIFDHGIVIDYNSTDSSMDIVRRICPTWTIIKSRNKYFEAIEIDNEFMDIEKTITGYKIVLNTTEFLVGSTELKQQLKNELNCYYPIKCLTALSSKEPIFPNNIKDLFQGIDRIEPDLRLLRVLHSYSDGSYTPGRHTITKQVTSSLPAYIIWFGFYPWNQHIINRKLQIKNNIPSQEIEKGFGFHHLWTYEEINTYRNNIFNKSVPTDSIDQLNNYLKI